MLILYGNAQQNFSVIGKIDGMPSTMVYLNYKNKGIAHTDSAVLNNGSITISNLISEPVMATLKMKDRPLSINFFLDGGITHIELAPTAPPKIEGTQAQKDYQSFIALVKDVLPLMKRTYNTYWDINIGKERDSLYDSYLSLQKELRKRIEEYVTKNNESVVGAWAVSENYYNAESSEIKLVYEKFSDKIKQSFYGREVKELFEITDKAAIGKKLKSFIAQDPDGRRVSIPSKADYILIDFWASWCLPCRKENPHLKDIYQKYQDNSFEIIGFSLDDNKDAWINAIKKDGVTWLNVSDLKGWGKSEICNELGINNVPMNILIDKDQKVIARNLRGNDLDRFLSNLIK